MDISQPESEITDELSGEASDSDSSLTRSRLENLSNSELVELADSLGLDIPFGLERIFIIEELLDHALDGQKEPKDDLENRPGNMETAALPKRYNISFIDVMIRDPLWAFVFWEIKGQDREIHENADDFNGYLLRVIPFNGQPGDHAPGESFTFPVAVNDFGRYLGFPKAVTENPASQGYIIKLCAIRGASEVSIAVSRTFSLPQTKPVSELQKNSCICLSGMREFSIIKSADRKSRAKRQQE